MRPKAQSITERAVAMLTVWLDTGDGADTKAPARASTRSQAPKPAKTGLFGVSG